MAEEKNEAVAEETPKKAPARRAAAKPAAKADDAKAEKAPAKKAPAKKAEQDVAKREPVLKVHHLRPAPGAKKDKTRVGRGEGSKGKTAGRGTKGSKARNNIRPGFEGGQLPYHMRAPKLRGFKNPFRVEYQVVNLDRLGQLFPDGGDVSVDDLVAKGAVRDGQLVKVLGTGELEVALRVSAHAFSGSARQKIEAAGGTATTL